MYSEAMIIKKLIYLYIEDSKNGTSILDIFLYSYVFTPKFNKTGLLAWITKGPFVQQIKL